MLPFSTLKGKLGYSPHSHPPTDRLVTELSMEMARKITFPHYPASTQLPLRQMFFSAFTQWLPSISLHKNHLWAHIPIRNLLLLCCGWRLTSPGTQSTGSRCLEKLCWPKRAGSNGGANGVGETPAPADDPLSKGSPEPLLLLLV